MGAESISNHCVILKIRINLAIQKNDPPIGDIDVNSVGAVLSQHLVLKVLHPENLFTICSRIHSCQCVDQGALPHVLKNRTSVNLNDGRSESSVCQLVTFLFFLT